MKHRRMSDAKNKRFSVGIAENLNALEDLLNSYTSSWVIKELKEYQGKHVVIMEKVPTK